MRLRFLDRRVRRAALIAVAFGLFAVAGTAAAQTKRELRVCSDPNNLPFSNEKEEGFENKIAELLARDLDATVRYTWWAQRRGFIRNTIKEDLCDIVMGVPAGYEPVATTRPYYRSSYVFLYRKGGPLKVSSFDDPVLKTAKIGVQMIGDDFANTPPAHALSSRGIVQNVVGYMVYGDYSKPNPPAEVVHAVARGDVDVSVVWGPLAGYFARREPTALELTPVSPQVDVPFFPMVFDISMGVKRGNDALKDELDRFITRRKPEIDRILDEYGVPRIEPKRGGA